MFSFLISIQGSLPTLNWNPVVSTWWEHFIIWIQDKTRHGRERSKQCVSDGKLCHTDRQWKNSLKWRACVDVAYSVFILWPLKTQLTFSSTATLSLFELGHCHLPSVKPHRSAEQWQGGDLSILKCIFNHLKHCWPVALRGLCQAPLHIAPYIPNQSAGNCQSTRSQRVALWHIVGL